MSKQELYDLFGAPEAPVNSSPEVAVEVMARQSVHEEKARTVGRVAADLYELDFAIETDDEDTLALNEEIAKYDLPLLTPPIADLSPTDDVQQDMSSPVVLPVEVTVHQPEAISVLEFPEKIVEYFKEVLPVILSHDSRVTFTLFGIEQLMKHEVVLSRADRWYFKEYCKQHEALHYMGDGLFGISERLTPDNYWPGSTNNGHDAHDDYSELIQTVIADMGKSDQDVFYIAQIKGFVRARGSTLFDKELDRVASLLKLHESITLNQDGSISVPHIQEDEILEPVQANTTYEVRNDKDIRTAMKEINRSDEMRRAKDLASNKADTRKHGRHRRKRGSRLQGRTHGKKLSFDQLLKQSLSTAPKPIAPTEIIVDGSIES